MPTLLNVDETLRLILAEITTLPAEEVALSDSLGRILAIDISAATPLPPFANSSMDGFAVRAADTGAATPDHPVTLPVSLDIAAGDAPMATLPPGTAARIMTGAPLPPGADAVVPLEATDAHWAAGDSARPPETIRIHQPARPGDCIRPAGEDIQAGQIVLRAGAEIDPPAIGVLAALGWPRVPVIRQPRVTILSSGDELIGVEEPLAPGKVRDSNSYVLEALVRQHGGLPQRIPVARDILADVRRRLQEALAWQPDLLISSAGVSVGAHDMVRTALDELGKIRLWRINLRPGKPLAYGRLADVPFFGLPGNPVSVQITFDVIVRPALLKMAGRPDVVPMAQAILEEDIAADGRLTYFRVRLRRGPDGQLYASSTGTQSSSAMLSMVLADGLLIIPAGVHSARAGEQFPVRLLRTPGWLLPV